MHLPPSPTPSLQAAVKDTTPPPTHTLTHTEPGSCWQGLWHKCIPFADREACPIAEAALDSSVPR